MAQLLKIRLPDGKVLTPSDWTSAEPLYSTTEIGVGGFPIQTAFSYGRGGTVPGSIGPRNATPADTNLEGEGSRLPENEELIIYQIAIEAFHIGAQSGADVLPSIDPPDVSLANMLRLQRDLVIITRIAGYKFEYTRQPMSWFPASTGTKQYNSAARTQISAGTVGYAASNNGGPDVEDGRHFSTPLYVAGGEALAVDFDPGPGSVVDLDAESAPGADDGRIRLRIYLEGYRRRPVA